MAADNELPVWTIRPNWRNGILERLEWLTDVMGSSYGTEQRTALRLSPRRTFEMTFNPIREVRSYFDLWLHRMGSQEFMVPLFHDRAKLTSPILNGEDVIPIDTTYREFVAGGMAVIIGDDPFTFDAVEIDAVAADSITLAAGVTQNWGKGVAVFPLRRTRISLESALAAITNRVGEATLQFELNQANDLPDEGAWAFTYGGTPIILDKPNRRENIDFTYVRNSMVLDNEVGLRELLDDAGRAFTIQTYGAMMRGRAEHWAFRQMLYRLRGQAVPCWLPTFNEDVVLASARLAADTYINVKKIGYAYTGGINDGREHLLLNGPVPLAAQITGLGASPLGQERLNLNGALGIGLPSGTTGSFMEIVRLSQDTVEITHHTDTDGVAECSLGFKAFRDERVVPGDLLDSPILPAAERATECGSVEQTLITWDHNFDYHMIFAAVDANPPGDTVIPAGPFDQNGNAPFGNDYNFEPPHPIATNWPPNRCAWLRTNIVADFSGEATFTGVIENGVVVFIDGVAVGWNNYQNAQQGGAYGTPFEFTTDLAAGAHTVKILIMDEGAGTGGSGSADNTYFHIEAVLRA